MSSCKSSRLPASTNSSRRASPVSPPGQTERISRFSSSPAPPTIAALRSCLALCVAAVPLTLPICTPKVTPPPSVPVLSLPGR